MAATKRKSEEKPAASSKKPADNNNERAQKRQRKDAPGKPTTGKDSKQSEKPGQDDVKERPAPKASLLQQEERAFPRGGGGVLTPLEHKQIQIQATKDVLFEESGQKKRTDEGILSDDDMIDAEDAPQKQKLSKGKKKKTQTAGSGEITEPFIRVDGLKFKRITQGCLVLGQVTAINSQEVVLDLPNNLSGTVPITRISETLTKKLESLADAEEILDDTQSRADENDEIDLKDYCHLGQYLRAYVVSKFEDSNSKDSSKARKRIELSVEPKLANGVINVSDVCINSTLQASVKSVEDHGLVMDLGLADSKFTGFLPKKDIPPGMEYSNIKEGAVFLCTVWKHDTKGRVVGLSAHQTKTSDPNKASILNKAPTVNVLVPGTAIEVLVSQVTASSIAGKVMGSVNASADIVHSGAGARNLDIESKYKVGSKIKARIIFTLGETDTLSLGVSVLDHLLSLAPRSVADGKGMTNPTDVLPISATVEQAKILNVESGLGLYVDLGVKGVPGFVHISRVSDGRVESLSPTTGTFRSGTSHRARIVGYNAMDGLFLASFEKAVLEQPYLRIEDVPVGGVVKATVEKIVLNATGVGGVILNLAQGITGLVPETHLADVHLQHPERKFKEGVQVTARVLSTDLEKRQIRLTLKKTLVNSDAEAWTEYSKVKVGSQSVGTILKLTPNGALVQFYGNVRAFLPVREMSDAYIQDPSTHFRVGQVVNVHALSVDTGERKITVSCRIPHATDAAQNAAFSQLKLGDVVSGTVSAITGDDITIELKDSGVAAVLRLGHLTDGSDQKNTSAMKRVRIGQQLQDLVVIELLEKKRSVVTSHKPSLMRAAKAGDLVTRFDQVLKGRQVEGFVRNVTPDAVYVQFAGGLTGLLHKSALSEDLVKLPGFGLTKDRSLSCRVSGVNPAQERFFLSMKPEVENTAAKAGTKRAVEAPDQQPTVNPVDKKSQLISDFSVGKITDARIISVKNTQLNVKLADNVQGRVDVSEVFNNWDDIKDRKNPLRSYHASTVIPVKILGMHDARNHRFLPISHRSGKVPTYELSAKLGEESSVVSLDQVKVGSWYTSFVNGITDMCLWVNLSPNVRGRIERMQISEDVSLLNDLEANFPIGSALRVRVLSADLSSDRLDLSAKAASADGPLTFDDVSVGQILTGRITKITERSILVQLSGTVSGLVGLTELADDYTQANPTIYQKNDVVRVCIIDVDKANKRITLSTRPSKVLSSSLAVKDASISTPTDLKINDTVRGFVKNVADIGVFVTLGYDVTGFVRVSELSDSFVKDWKTNYEIDRLITGKIIAVDATSKHVQMSLKPSIVSADYVPKLTFNDLIVGQVVTGTIRKVEEFGAFILVDNSHNVSGLCHRSEIAEKRVDDVKKLYSEGDAVKAIVLKVEPEKRRISFGLKASYFDNASEEDSDENSDADVEMGSDIEQDDGVDGGIELDPMQLSASSEGDDDSANDEEMAGAALSKSAANGNDGLDVGGFDWGGSLQRGGQGMAVESDAESEAQPKKKKKQKSQIKIDETGDLDKLGPRSASDFERLLLGQRDSSSLWVQYMAFQLQLSDIEEARKIAERALKEISIREQEEKMNVWVAYLNLENAYGSDETVEEIFKRACEVNDGQQIHERLTSIYIQSGKHSVRSQKTTFKHRNSC